MRRSLRHVVCVCSRIGSPTAAARSNKSICCYRDASETAKTRRIYVYIYIPANTWHRAVRRDRNIPQRRRRRDGRGGVLKISRRNNICVFLLVDFYSALVNFRRVNSLNLSQMLNHHLAFQLILIVQSSVAAHILS